MNIRMQSDLVNGTGVLQTPGTAPGAGTGKSRGTGIAGAGADSVALSKLASQLADANRVAEQHENARVQALASLYSRGEYNLDSRDLSRSLISHSLSGSFEGEL